MHFGFSISDSLTALRFLTLEKVICFSLFVSGIVGWKYIAKLHSVHTLEQVWGMGPTALHVDEPKYYLVFGLLIR